MECMVTLLQCIITTQYTFGLDRGHYWSTSGWLIDRWMKEGMRSVKGHQVNWWGGNEGGMLTLCSRAGDVTISVPGFHSGSERVKRSLMGDNFHSSPINPHRAVGKHCGPGYRWCSLRLGYRSTAYGIKLAQSESLWGMLIKAPFIQDHKSVFFFLLHVSDQLQHAIVLDLKVAHTHTQTHTQRNSEHSPLLTKSQLDPACCYLEEIVIQGYHCQRPAN